MKMLILLLIFFIAGCFSAESAPLHTKLGLEAGFFPYGHTFLYEYHAQVDHTNSYYVASDMQIILLDVVYINTLLQVDMTKGGDDGMPYEFRPVDLLSVFDIGFSWNFFSIGYKHSCIHPITPYDPLYHAIIRWEGWKAAVYARAEIGF